MRIVQVSTRDLKGGAERIAWYLHKSYLAQGYDAHLLVGQKFSDDPSIHTLTHARDQQGPWTNTLYTTAQALEPWHGKVKGAWRVSRALQEIAEPQRTFDRERGVEDFHFPDTYAHIQQLRPDVLHAHNLHGGYFDLRVLKHISWQIPTIITMHDMWLLTGHCAYSVGCARWKTGCGKCPDLELYPRIKRDASAYNWERKADIYRASRLYISTPAQWLKNAVEQSNLRHAVHDIRVIPNGVNQTIFRPKDQAQARQTLHLPEDAHILLFAAVRVGAKPNPYKDYETIEQSLEHIATLRPPNAPPLLMLMMGQDGEEEQIADRVYLRPLGFIHDPEDVARYYQAADIYLHSSKADTFPNAILEALSCGTPVIGSALDGIPEQIRSLSNINGYPYYPREEATGLLVPPEDPLALAEGIIQLLEDDNLRQQLSRNAAQDAQQRFKQERMVQAYLNWYAELIQGENADHTR